MRGYIIAGLLLASISQPGIAQSPQVDSEASSDSEVSPTATRRSIDTPIAELLASDDSREVVNRHFPGVVNFQHRIPNLDTVSLREYSQQPNIRARGVLNEELLATIDADLASLDGVPVAGSGFSIDTPLEVLLASPSGRAVLETYLPSMVAYSPNIPNLDRLTLRAMAENETARSMGGLTPELLSQIDEDLQEL
ncbi:hypothetical protein [Aurantiacibacter gilvus]|uniref:Uncharacterized protein n=1 Tax=Aurantiacibacter gilvus TaxID=3139141 RepID=A0ABU9IFG1_9SPHN